MDNYHKHSILLIIIFASLVLSMITGCNMLKRYKWTYLPEKSSNCFTYQENQAIRKRYYRQLRRIGSRYYKLIPKISSGKEKCIGLYKLELTGSSTIVRFFFQEKDYVVFDIDQKETEEFLLSFDKKYQDHFSPKELKEIRYLLVKGAYLDDCFASPSK